MVKKTTGQDQSDAGTLPGFLTPRVNPFLVGHHAAQKTLITTFQGNHFPHAWLLGGPEGIGKATLAYQFVRNIFEHNMTQSGHDGLLAALPETSPVFTQIASGAHPNMLVLERCLNPKTKKFYSVIRVDDVRALNKFFGFTSGEGAWRFVIIDRAEDMNNNAANALLKILEEPPENAVFFLVSSAPDQLPATILSRCRKLRLHGLENDDLERAVQFAFKNSGYDLPVQEVLDHALKKSGGSVRDALKYSVGNGLALEKQLRGLLAKLPYMDFTLVHAMADRVTARGAEDDFHTLHLLLGTWLGNRIRATVIERPVGPMLFSGSSLVEWVTLWEDIHKSKAEMMLLNLDKRTHIITMFYSIHKLARDIVNRAG